MASYTIRNANGDTVATINPATTTGATFSIELPGKGFSLYGQLIDQNMYRMLENFASGTAPAQPIIGQLWYNTTEQAQNFWDGSNWIKMAAGNNAMVRFRMAAGATNVNFAANGSTVIFTHPGTTAKYYPTSLLLVPKSVVSVSTPAGFNLSNLVSEDVMETALISGPTTSKSGYFPIEGMIEPVTTGNSITLNVTSAATGGGGLQLKYDAFLFGFVR